MNNFVNPFDPSLSELFVQQNSDKINKSHLDSELSRQLFYQLNQPHQFKNMLPLAYDYISLWLEEADQVYKSSYIKDDGKDKFISLNALEITTLPDSYLTQENLNQCIKQSTPIVLTQPVWLQQTFMIAYSQSKIANQLLAIYLQLTGTVKKKVELLNSYHSLLLARDIRLPNLHSYSYSQQSDIARTMFDFAAIQLALASFPRVLFPEILGFTLAYCQTPTLIEVCFPNHQLPSQFFKHRDDRLKRQLPLLRECISDYLGVFNQKKNQLWQRTQNGYWLYQLQMQRCKEGFKEQIDKHAVNDQDYSKKVTETGFLQEKKVVKFSNKELYYYLLNADIFPDALPMVQIKVRRWLRACAMFIPLPFKHYDHERFSAYLDKIYQQELAAYQPLQGKPKISKEAYIWGIEQIAPMILIDGCWLQNSLAIKNSYPEISEILFSIYCDEIGNGQLKQNHPYIFQQLLDSLSIKLPSVDSPEFIKHPGFINSAFDLPVYMLSLSRCSLEFLPELLGLNMAIELSGLGKDYKRLVEEWLYWDIDPTIADIHISIDNVVSGHTFLAKKAIQLYMDDLFQRTADKTEWDRHWRRIYTGYASLRFVGGWFKFNLPIWYLISKFKGKIPEND